MSLSSVGCFFGFSESVLALGLTVPPNNSSNSKRYTTAEVVDKEYCQAKKSGNRFKVPQGTKFYRVRCKPGAIAPAPKDVMTRSSTATD